MAGVLRDPELFGEIVRSIFSDHDRDGSGLIDKSELGNAIRHLYQEAGIPTPTDESALAEFDTDQSGQLTLEEFGPFVRQFIERNL